MSGLLISRDKAVDYGMPHIGARYTRDDVRRYELVENEDGWTPCAVCGRRAQSVHHMPPISRSSCIDDDGRKRPGSLLLNTQYGKFVLKPALIALCGNGTMGCHGMYHDGRLKIQWVFDSPRFEEAWLSGEIMTHGIDGYIETRDGGLFVRPVSPHSSQLYRIGRWEFTVGGRTWEYRGDV